MPWLMTKRTTMLEGTKTPLSPFLSYKINNYGNNFEPQHAKEKLNLHIWGKINLLHILEAMIKNKDICNYKI